VSYLSLDKIKEAAADLDEAAQADPQNAEIWTNRGLAYERLGDKAKAAGSYSRFAPEMKRRETALPASAASPARTTMRSRAIPSELFTGSRKENASKPAGACVLIQAEPIGALN
jgi:tetratricopeptide (TPR) repeat protein